MWYRIQGNLLYLVIACYIESWPYEISFSENNSKALLNLER